MLVSVLNEKFESLLFDIANYFKINEQNDFESYELVNVDGYNNHDFLKYIDLVLAISDTHIEIDYEVAIRLARIEKYKPYLGCNFGFDDFDLSNPTEYSPINQDRLNALSSNYQYILYKYEVL